MALRLLLEDKACLKGLQVGPHDIVGEIGAKLNCTAMGAGKVLLQDLAGIDEPEILCAASHVLIPAHAFSKVITRSIGPCWFPRLLNGSEQVILSNDCIAWNHARAFVCQPDWFTTSINLLKQTAGMHDEQVLKGLAG